MKRLIVALLVVVGVIRPIEAADRWHKALYAVEAYNCAAALTDGGTTRYGIETVCTVELTMIGFRGQTKANFNWGGFVLFKGLECGVPVLVSVVAHRASTSASKKLDYFLIGPTAALAAWQKRRGTVNNWRYTSNYWRAHPVQ